VWCGLGSEAVCLFLCTKCAACKRARDRGRGPGHAANIVSWRERSHDRRDNRCYGNVPVLSTRSSCEMAVKKYSAASSETLSFHSE